MRQSLKHVIFAAMLSVFAPVAGAQDATTTNSIQPIGGLAFVDEIELTVVNVNVYVTDKDGRAVTDLKPEDFFVAQDGQAKEISNFDVFSYETFKHRLEQRAMADQTPQETAADEPDLRPVHVIIYLDHDNLAPLDRNRVIRQMRDFIRDNLHPPVRMMVVSYNKSLKTVQDFTSESSQVLNAIRGEMKTTGGSTNRDSSRKDILDKMQRHTQDQGQSSTQGPQRMHSEVISFAENEANDLAFTLGALRQTVLTLAGLPGKKAFIYISNGLPMVAGMDLFYAFANAYDSPSILTMSAQYDQSRHFRSLVAAANAQDVSFYTIGAGGLRNRSMGTAEYAGPRDTISSSVGQHNYQDSLRFMAENTGGAAILNTNDIRERLHLVSQDFFTYYSLGYPLNVSGGDKVHKIEVELPNHSQYDLRYRRRFVEKSLETRVQDKVVTALSFDISDNPMQMDLSSANAAPATEDRWIMPIKVSFPLRKVALLPEVDDYVGRLVLFIAARDTEGKQSEVVRQEHEVRVPSASYEESQRRRFTIDASLLMESGSHRIAVAVFDQITRQSSYQVVQTFVGQRK